MRWADPLEDILDRTSFCTSCGFEAGAQARFCERCGQRLQTPEAEGGGVRVEARQATVLFCDLVQSTQLAVALDLEDLRAVFRSFWRVVTEVTRRHKGHVMRFVGDGAVVPFGHSHAQEDAAEVAIRAGLDLVQEFLALPRTPGSTALRLRVGIASGMVAVGDLIDQAAVIEQALIGSTVHLAARLSAAAPPDGVVVADSVRRQAGRFFNYSDFGRLELRGFPAPQQAWLVLGVSGIASRFQAGSGDEFLPLVGRAALLQRLRDEWRLACGAQLRSAVLVGEPGIGKSRLADSVRQMAQAEDATIIVFDCMQRHGLTPLHPVQVWLRGWIGIVLEDTEAQRRERSVTELGRLLGPAAAEEAVDRLAPLLALQHSAELSAELVRERSIAVVLDVLGAFAARAPVLLVCEDLHWADASTKQLLQRIAQSQLAMSLFVLATSRPDAEPADAIPSGLAEFPVEALPDEDALALVHQASADHPLAAHTVASIVERCGGVPLYLEELTRSALDAAGLLPPEDAPAGAAPLAMPTRVQALIQARLGRLPELRPLAQAAAVIGREFTQAMLEPLLDGAGAQDLADKLDKLVEARVLVAASTSGRWRFRHALTQDAAYQTLLRNDRCRLHARVASLLRERFAGQPDATLDVLGHHLAAAQLYGEAADNFLSASTEAAARAAYVESAGHARAGLAALAKAAQESVQSTTRLRLSTQLALGLAATQGYAAPAVEQAYSEARQLCTPDTDPEVRFAVARGMATFYIVRCRLATADDLATQCIQMAEDPDIGGPAMRIEALTAVGYCKTYLGRLPAGREALERCLALYELHQGRRFIYPSAQDPAVAAGSLLAIIDWLQGEDERSRARIQRTLHWAEELARPFDRAYAACYAAKLANLQGRSDDALRHAGECVAISQTHGLGTWLAAGTLQAAVAMAMGSDTAQGVATLEHVLGLFMQAGAELNAPYFLWGMAHGHERLGNRAAANQSINDALLRCRSSGEVYLQPRVMLDAATWCGSPEDAQALRREALSLAEAQQSAALVALARSALALQQA